MATCMMCSLPPLCGRTGQHRRQRRHDDEAAANTEHARDESREQPRKQHRADKYSVLLERRAQPVLLSHNFRHVVKRHANFPVRFSRDGFRR